MKIAVPTQDGLRIVTDFGLAEAFLVLTIQAEEIIAEELRRNPLNNYNKEPLALINDCSVVMVNKVDKSTSELIRKNDMECLETKEILITNAIIHYLKNEYRKEANMCCSP
ncbi:MAG: hypothetical protein ISR57_02045 [Bacteroidales bacterium]|nr:hypothetical protein [Bacteroidota bacterium]MBL6949401.1 hypothetical protein [Bacteroidales bacterium]